MRSSRETTKSSINNNQRGSALITAILIILVLTVIGIYAVTTSTVDTQITGYQRLEMVSFCSAESGLEYAMATFRFGDVDKNNQNDDFDSPNNEVKFSGKVYYHGKTNPPVGSATGSRTKFKAHYHRVESMGKDPSDKAHSTIHAWGYRIGF